MTAYLPLDGRPFRASVGTRPLDLDDWIEIDHNRPREIAEKTRLLRESPDDVVSTIPGSEAGIRETTELLLAFLPRRFPDVYSEIPGGLHDHQLQRDVVIDNGSALAQIGLLVQEDLCIMTRSESGSWVLTAGSLSSPSHWSLREKIGKDLSGLHAPVPYYAERLAAPTEALFNRLAPDQAVWRLNWTIVGSAEGFLTSDRARWPLVEQGEDIGEALFFRVERQTLRCLPRSGDILFTIRTYIRSLAELPQLRETAYADLLDAIDFVPDEVTDYRGWAPILDPLRAWLRGHLPG